MNSSEIRSIKASGSESLLCDSKRCLKCFGDTCEERFEDIVFGVGP